MNYYIKMGEDPVAMVWNMKVAEIEEKGKMTICEIDYVEEV